MPGLYPTVLSRMFPIPIPELKLSIITLLLIYLTYVHHRRYHRLKFIQNKYGTIWQDGKLSPEQAQEILQNVLFYESPLVLRLGTQSALLKVYALPSFAKLLVNTGQLKSPDTISKRIADTATLIATWLSCPLVTPGVSNSGSESSDPRGAIAVARVNYLHRKYQITNEDFLYNLGLFIHEPWEWMTRYDWRAPTDMERDAIFIFWREIGRRMGMHSIWESWQEMAEWMKDYEEVHIVPSEESKLLADTTISFFLRRFPAFFGIRVFFQNAALALLADKHRAAMGLPDPPRFFRVFVPSLLKFRGLVVRYFCIPRRRKSLYVSLDVPPSSESGSKRARMHAVYRRPIPWYYPESRGLRRIRENISVRLGIADPEKLPGARWKSEGYRLEELGPIQFEKQGHREVLQMAAELQGCPIQDPWGLDDRTE